VDTASGLIAYEDAPLGRFHMRVAVASVVGAFTDGYGIGIIGIALSFAAPQLALAPLWVGLVGAASLAGLLVGALVTGPVADQFGRRPIFAYNMAWLALVSCLQLFAASGIQLVIERLAVGFLLGTDYVVSKAVLSEFTPLRYRGRILSSLSVAWAAGYTCAYPVGFALTGQGSGSWRWMLASGALPCLLNLPLRLTIPESPMWLADKGHADHSARIVRRTLGAAVVPPTPRSDSGSAHGWRQLFSISWRRNTLVACTFFVCQVIPYFAIGTFVSRIMAGFKAIPDYLGGLFYNLALLLGAIVGVLIVDRLSRRRFLVGSFAVTGAAMFLLTVGEDFPAPVIISLFVVFAGALSAAASLVYVYLPELFPTELRASGIGLAIAASRSGSAVGTFLLPIVVAALGVRVALGCCVAVLAVGGLVCQLWARETRGVRLETLTTASRDVHSNA
jgi:MFS transporter, putative metabolite transport protein